MTTHPLNRLAQLAIAVAVSVAFPPDHTKPTSKADPPPLKQVWVLPHPAGRYLSKDGNTYLIVSCPEGYKFGDRFGYKSQPESSQCYPDHTKKVK